MIEEPIKDTLDSIITKPFKDFKKEVKVRPFHNTKRKVVKVIECTINRLSSKVKI